MDYYAELDKQYKIADQRIQAKIEVWYSRFANNNNISILDAKRMLNSKELAEFKWDVKQYIEYGRENALDQRWIKELENASAKVHISRLESLRLQIQHQNEILYGNQLDGIDKLAKDIFSDSYYHTAYEIQKGLNVGWDLHTLDDKKLSTIVNKPWTTDGQTFSDRIWTNKTKLIGTIQTELTQSIMRGEPVKKAIERVSKTMNVGKHQAARLVLTESAYFHSAAQGECFKDLNVELYEIVATLDRRTSEICQDLDGGIYNMKDYQPGETAPPFHPYCRTVTAPKFLDEEGYRAARNDEGKTYLVPSDMTYKKWKESFVDGGSKDVKPISTTIPNVKGLVEPKRPSRRDYDTYEEHQDALSKWRVEKEAFDNKINEVIQYNVNKPRLYDTKESILKWADENEIIINDDTFEKIDLRVFDDIIPVLDDTFKKYPELKTLDMIDPHNGKPLIGLFEIGPMPSYSNSALMNANGGLELGKVFENYEEMLDMALRSMTDGYTVIGDGTFSTLVRHELGHRMQTYIEMVKLKGDVHKGVEVSKDIAKLKSMNLKGVSEYANTREAEFFAEGFASFESGENTEFAIEFGKLLKRWLK